MITAPWTPGVPASWVTGDEVYGADPRLAGCLEGRSIGYVLAIAGNRRRRPAHRPPRSSPNRMNLAQIFMGHHERT
jgi:hypothetical protein